MAPTHALATGLLSPFKKEKCTVMSGTHMMPLIILAVITLCEQSTRCNVSKRNPCVCLIFEPRYLSLTILCCTAGIKKAAVEEFTRHVDAYMRKPKCLSYRDRLDRSIARTSWATGCRSWYKNGKVDGRVTQWPCGLEVRHTSCKPSAIPVGKVSFAVINVWDR